MALSSNRGLLIGAVAVSVLIAACGGGTSATSTPATSQSPPTASGASPTTIPTSTPPPRPTLTAVPVPAGDLRFVVSNVGTYGLLPMVNIAVNKTHLDAMYDPLVGLDATGQPDVKSGLIFSWTASADGKVWTIKSREGVVFHNGEKANSKDLKASLDWYGSADGNGGQSNNARAAQLASIDLPDDSTAVLNFKVINIFAVLDLLSLSGLGVSANYLISKSYMEANGSKAYNRAPIGSGPFKYKSDILNQELNLEAVDAHWLYGAPRYKTLAAKIIAEDGTRVALLKAGGADFGDIPRDSGPALKKSGFDILLKEGSKYACIQLFEQWVETFKNGVKNPLSDARVRQALSLAIDRDILVQQFMYGLAQPSMDIVAPPGDLAYRPHPVPKQDMAKARQLLADAGYPQGFEMDLWIWATPGLTTESTPIMEAVAVWWEQLELKIKRVPTDFAIGIPKISAHDFSKPTALGVGWGATPVHVAGLLPGVSLRNIGYRFTEDPDLEQARRAISAATSIRDYTIAAQKVQDLYIERTFWISMFLGGEVWAVKGGLGGDKWSLGKNQYNYNIASLAAGRPEIVR